MSNLIEVVASLQELEKKATSGPWGTDSTFGGRGIDALHTNGIWANEWQWSSPTLLDLRFVAQMRNAAPDLFKVLAGFQPGDSKRLNEYLLDMDPRDPVSEVLARMQAMARLMEASK